IHSGPVGIPNPWGVLKAFPATTRALPLGTTIQLGASPCDHDGTRARTIESASAAQRAVVSSYRARAILAVSAVTVGASVARLRGATGRGASHAPKNAPPARTTSATASTPAPLRRFAVMDRIRASREDIGS